MGAELWWVVGGAGALVVLAMVVVVFGVLLERSNRAPAVADASKQAKTAVEHLVPPHFRTGLMVVVTVVLLVAVFWVARQQIGVLVYKAVLITMAAVLGYWADRTAFPYSRPHMFEDPEVRWRFEIRRAYVISAAMLTAGLGA